MLYDSQPVNGKQGEETSPRDSLLFSWLFHLNYIVEVSSLCRYWVMIKDHIDTSSSKEDYWDRWKEVLRDHLYADLIYLTEYREITLTHDSMGPIDAVKKLHPKKGANP